MIQRCSGPELGSARGGDPILVTIKAEAQDESAAIPAPTSQEKPRIFKGDQDYTEFKHALARAEPGRIVPQGRAPHLFGSPMRVGALGQVMSEHQIRLRGGWECSAMEGEPEPRRVTLPLSVRPAERTSRVLLVRPFHRPPVNYEARGPEPPYGGGRRVGLRLFEWTGDRASPFRNHGGLGPAGSAPSRPGTFSSWRLISPPYWTPPGTNLSGESSPWSSSRSKREGVGGNFRLGQPDRLADGDVP